MAMDLYAEITNRMIAEMEQGIIPWHKPWMSAGAAVSHTTGRPYSLLNQLMLGRPGEYLTMKQVDAEGGHVRKGQKAQMVVFWKWIEKKDEEKDKVDRFPILKYFNVFHIDQCDGITPKYTKEPEVTADPDAAADAIIRAYTEREGVRIVNMEGDKACYNPRLDQITLPLMKQFTETAEYYGAAFHEMVHSTGHEKRLKRLDTTANFGGEEYSKEELVAEIGSAALLHHVGLDTPEAFRNSTAYVQNWLTVLKNDKRFIVSAAGRADKAVTYILEGV